MRKLLLMVAFGLGSMLLLPTPARSLDDCTACLCKEMKAWTSVDPLSPGTFGLRDVDPMNNERTIPVSSVPYTDHRLLAAAPDAGVRTLQKDASGKEIQLSLYSYSKTPDKDCNVAAGEPKSSTLRVNFANAADWDACTQEPLNSKDWPYLYKCIEPAPPPPPKGP